MTLRLISSADLDDLAQNETIMDEVSTQYTYYQEYQWMRRKIIQFTPKGLKIEVGTTAHYNLPDFRLTWQGIRVIGMFPRPKGVEILLEYDKFLHRRDLYDPVLIDRFEDAAGALIVNKNRLLVLRSLEAIDEEYIDTYLNIGMALLLEELKRRHPDKQDESEKQ